MKICTHLEELASFVDGLPQVEQTRDSQRVSQLSISAFSNTIREYSVVEQPLSDLTSLLVALCAILNENSYLDYTDLQRLADAVSSIKRVIETYLDTALFKGIKRRVYLTMVTVLSIYCLRSIIKLRLE